MPNRNLKNIKSLIGGLGFKGSYALDGLVEELSIIHRYPLVAIGAYPGMSNQIMPRLRRVQEILVAAEFANRSSIVAVDASIPNIPGLRALVYGQDDAIRVDPVDAVNFKSFMAVLQHKTVEGSEYKLEPEVAFAKIKFQTGVINRLEGKIELEMNAKGESKIDLLEYSYEEKNKLSYTFGIVNTDTVKSEDEFRMLLFILNRILHRATSYQNDSIKFGKDNYIKIATRAGEEHFAINSVDDLAVAVIQVHQALHSNCVPKHDFPKSCLTFFWDLYQRTLGQNEPVITDTNPAAQTSLQVPLLKP